MIVTLTLNPSVDRTVSVDGLTVGEVHRATSSRVDPGGKGINVTRALTANGTESIAVYPTGGPEGALMKRLLDAAGIARAAVSVVGSIRMNITIVDPHGVTTKVNEPGPRLSPAEVEAVRATTAEHLGRGGAQWLVISGSLPPGVDPAVYGDLVRLGHAAGARVAIDTSGATLAAAVAASPDVVKPNRDELAELLGTELPTLAAVRDAAYRLVNQGITTVLVSLGKDGALLVRADAIAHASGKATPVSTVGAGDCTLAGYLHASVSGATPVDALAEAVRWGSAAVSLPGSQVPGPADLARVPVTLDKDPDLHTLVTD
ncbi:MAG TPA: 1-phosphofructokinase [Tetrasphaera sp.]|jgi:1-phosphofructokinase/6-phosphofructokinase 2|uniref:1-phosphofructokinase n=1 Tax=Nostocoides sp. TaxID=1917966 RepID=UPI002B6C641B|nr:1-phosphofructokinase [Tetrasphaera sp.]MBK9726089.1 1-phosphofructokinase [Candidatus Lutibacillus vidarii]HNQ07604.1 1-phosphofructokinase [Tetrasphaera sp.]HON73513.1 1-phosphofructokinase [Dermatophilaceae bacterium]HRB99261.1 1-phosphofructokinase [Dermatophilaceae bacterium]